MAKIRKRSRLKPKTFALPKARKYPITDAKHARNAIARVTQHGSPAEKRAVYAAVRKRHPSVAKRSTVVPTKTGPGRHYGEPKGTTH
jgi:hypothetical protein